MKNNALFSRLNGSSLLSLIFWLAVGYVFLAGLLYVFQDRFIYHPAGELMTTPADRGWPHEDVTFPSGEETLHGWWLPASADRGTLLFMHGNAGNISGRLDAAVPFLELGLNVFLFDYRGYGRSTGTPSEQGLYQDAEAAWRYLTEKKRISPGRIVLLGRSLGGGPATWLAGRTQPAALMLESTFTSVPDMARKRFPFFPVRLLARTRFNNRRRVAELDVPLLVVHSPDDAVVPFEHGRRLYEAAASPKFFMEIQGQHHNGFQVTGARYTAEIDDFLDVYLDPEPPQKFPD